MRLTQDMQDYLQGSQEELKQLIRDLCAIPAPSRHEEKRAAFCRDWFAAAGFEGVYIDEALNVVCPYCAAEEADLVVFMAHTDTVFPDLEPMPMREDGRKMYCPGVCDDTGNLAVMMLCARYFLRRGLRPGQGVLFVANSCEEGLGNLKGSGEIVRAFGGRIRELISFDGGSFHRIVDRAVGSHRYRVRVRTEGGHSYAAFGNRNAIRYLASLIDTLYAVKVPEKAGCKTTYNVGLISGGTSVNTIAQQAEMLYEYRSDDRECLEAMRRIFESAVETYRAMGVEVEVERVGERPCAGNVDAQAHARLIRRAEESIRAIVGREPVRLSGSTDCNIPLSVGIPAVCLSAVTGARMHTREEELDLDSLLEGCRLTMDFMAGYFVP